VIETDEQTWKNFGFDKLSETDMLPVIENVFAEELDGHKLIANRSLWRNFPTITNKTWVKGNAVLVGDAKATAHFSIGSGTKLAMEDAISLFESLRKQDSVGKALAQYDTARREEVEKTQHAANVSLAWFEHMKRYWGMEPVQFAFGVMSRSKQITWENLELRDPAFVKTIHQWFAKKVREQGFEIDLKNPPGADVHAFPAARHGAREPGGGLADGPVLGGRRRARRLAFRAPRQPRGRRCGARLRGDDLPVAEGRISPGDTGLWNEAQRDAFKRIVDFAHANSKAKMCMQLGHSGRKGLDAARLGAHGSSARERQLAGGLSLADSLLRRGFAGPARNESRRHGQGRRRFSKKCCFCGSGGFRHARDPHGARLPARELHLAPDEQKKRRIRRLHREPHAISPRGLEGL
jgi:anthraniloyl-CoA monooxygenase